MKDLEILENIDLNKILDELRARDKKLNQLKNLDQKQSDKIHKIQRAEAQKYEEMKRKFEKEREAKLDAFEKLEAMRMEMKALEGKDIKNDLWKDKCRELYDICNDLEKENENLKSSCKSLNAQMSSKDNEIALLSQKMA